MVVEREDASTAQVFRQDLSLKQDLKSEEKMKFYEVRVPRRKNSVCTGLMFLDRCSVSVVLMWPLVTQDPQSIDVSDLDCERQMFWG